MTNIHPSAVIDPSATIADGVSIGAFSVIGADVTIEEETWIGSHVVINGPTKIGKRNKIYQFASLGEKPQDKKYAGEPTWLEIGDDNEIREFTTFNRGTVQDGGKTVLGNRNWIMAYVHIAHDCVVGDDTVFANGASLAGHVHIGNNVVMGGFALVYQFVTVGDYSICGFSSGVKMDVPPYSMVEGMPAQHRTANVEGLRRNGFSSDEIRAIKQAFRTLYRQGLTLEDASAELRKMLESAPVILPILEFLPTMRRGLIR